MGDPHVHLRRHPANRGHRHRSRQVAALLIAGLLAGGCSYDERKALRNYDTRLEPVRDIAGELRRYQPRITEKSSADKIRTYVADEILYRSTRVIDVLSEIHPQSDELRDLHKQLESIWMSYHDGFEQFVEDLTDENLPAKRRRLSEILSRCDVRWGTWNAELQRLHEGVRGWSESAPI